MMDRPEIEIDRFQAPKSVLDSPQALASERVGAFHATKVLKLQVDMPATFRDHGEPVLDNRRIGR